MVDRVLFHGEVDDHFEALAAQRSNLAQIVFFLAEGPEAVHGFVIQSWHGKSLVHMVERRWNHLRGHEWDFVPARCSTSVGAFCCLYSHRLR